MRYEPTYKPYIRTTPPGRPWVQLNGEGWRPLVTWDLDLMRGQYGPKVVPDKYKVKLIVDTLIKIDRDFEECDIEQQQKIATKAKLPISGK